MFTCDSREGECMKHLRTKLFLSVGIIFLCVAMLNYSLPEIFVRKELDRVAVSLKRHLDQLQTRLNQFSSFLVTYRIVESAAELSGMTKMVAADMSATSSPSLWAMAAKITSYSPQVAFVQVTDQSGRTAVVSPEDAKLYSPGWLPFEEEMLLVKIAEKEELFVAIPDGPIYLLFNEKSLRAIAKTPALTTPLPPPIKAKLALAASHIDQGISSPFNQGKSSSNAISSKETISELYETLFCEENEWLEKIDLIDVLIKYKETSLPLIPAGALKIEQSTGSALCLLTAEVFLQTAVITDFSQSESSNVPYALIRQGQNGKDVDIARTLTLTTNGKEHIAIGFSISSMVKKMAEIAGKPVIIHQKDHFSLGLGPDGKEFDPASSIAPFDDLIAAKGVVLWNKKKYIPAAIDLKELQLIVLTPEAQANALTHFLTDVRHAMSQKISLNLLAAAVVSLILALFFLGRTSKRITSPIVQLSAASEELGKGKYDGLVLPNLGKRRDEVAVLTHSFQKLVMALRDRDKIRGVLNKVVSKEISEEILKGKIELGGEERTITMLFSDIRGFTHFSENLDPRILIGMLNDYMTQMCRIIDETRGVVDKFVGDEIMALYGAPLELDQHAIHALEAAQRKIACLREWNENRKLEGQFPFEIGIGIHTGLVLAGNMGAENRLNYTVIGANVNLASRLCSQAKPMQVLVSEETWKMPGVREKFRFNDLPPLTLKGIDVPVKAYELIL
jgi:class 3 adenylate cyclase